MLSRIAESLYWMSRYLERVDSTARLVEINLLHMVEAEDAVADDAAWKPLLAILGNEAGLEKWQAPATSAHSRFPRSEPQASGENQNWVIDYLTRERSNPGAIRASLRGARENARVVRDRISKEMWECVNDLWLRSERRLERPLAPDYYETLRSEVARFHGLTVSTMMRGEAFGFYLLGFFLERADMTCRILDVKYHRLLPDASLVGSPLDYYQWAALLKSMSGYEAYRRRHASLRPLDVAAFVVLDPDFPRSLRFAVDRIEQALVSIGPRTAASAAAAELASLLDKHDAGSMQDGLHAFLDEFLRRSSALHAALEEEYFEAHLGEHACAS
jgi:uncharacterized alpha-E superfamily protein